MAPDAILSGATPRFVKMSPAEKTKNDVWSYDKDELAAAFGPQKRKRSSSNHAPTTPPEKFFTRTELEFIRDPLRAPGTPFCITDEIYEHILYDDTEHITMGPHRRHARPHHRHKRYVEGPTASTGWRVRPGPLPRPKANRVHPQSPRFPDGRPPQPRCNKPGATAFEAKPQTYYGQISQHLHRKTALACLKILTQAGFNRLQNHAAPTTS